MLGFALYRHASTDYANNSIGQSTELIIKADSRLARVQLQEEETLSTRSIKEARQRGEEGRSLPGKEVNPTQQAHADASAESTREQNQKTR